MKSKIQIFFNKRNSLFYKWVKGPTKRNRHAFQKLRIEIKRLKQNANGGNFEKLGNNPSAKMRISKLKNKKRLETNKSGMSWCR